MIDAVASDVLWGTAAWWAYVYGGYPVLLSVLAPRRRTVLRSTPERMWPLISICIPAHNEASSIADTITRVLALDYPADRRQVVIVSDASTDGTDDIVAAFATQGVELYRMSDRIGKTEGENRTAGRLRGDLIVNTDASVIVDRAALKLLVSAFDDPTVGAASARDISVARAARTSAESTRGESAYVGYEMTVRALETRVSGLVGASGCLYAVRAPIQRVVLPGGLSRDFAVALLARERGFRTVAVHDAVCYVPRSGSLRREYRRKTRTITRGLATLVAYRRLLNPLRYGAFAWMLCSHKLMRWLAPVWACAAAVAVAVLSPAHGWARIIGGLLAIGAGAAAVGYSRSERGDRGVVGRACALAAFVVSANIAVVHAWVRLLRGTNPAVWEPTRRSVGAPVTQ